MKVDFKAYTNVEPGSVFFLYGNYKKAFALFSDVTIERLKEKHANVSVSYCSVADCLKKIGDQCSLFDSSVSCFCIQDVEDSHLAKISPYLGDSDKVFILDSGDYVKSKQVTEFFVAHKQFHAIASFKNNLTMQSIVRMVMPNASPVVINKVMGIINNTDEDLSSLFKKITVLCEDGDLSLLDQYAVYKKSFWDGMDFIPLARVLLQSAIRLRVFDKHYGDVVIGRKQDDIEYLLTAEMRQKFQHEMPNSYLYRKLENS